MRPVDKRLNGINRLVSKRFCNHPILGTFSDVFYNGVFICVTVEQPNRNNKRFVSCIPAGVYQLLPYSSDKYPETFALHNPMLNVFDTLDSGEKAFEQNIARENFRYSCVLHTANWADDIEGCIGAGEKLGNGKKKNAGWSDSRWMVTNSSKTTKQLKELIKDEGITHIEIQDVSNEIIDEELYYG